GDSVAYFIIGPNRLSAGSRKAPLVVAVTISLVLLLAAAVYAGCCAAFGWPPDGMMPPDDSAPIFQTGHGHTWRYDATKRTHISTTLQRNRVNWVSIKKTGGFYEIADPNGTGNAVIKL